MDGCTDGTFTRTGQKFFNCPKGRGFYCHLKNLIPSAMNRKNNKSMKEHYLVLANMVEVVTKTMLLFCHF